MTPDYSLYRMHSVQARRLTRCNIELSACKLYLSQVTKAIEALNSSKFERAVAIFGEHLTLDGCQTFNFRCLTST